MNPKEQDFARLVAALQVMGCSDPEAWAQSEIDENIAQVARYRFLHQLWPRLIDGWSNGLNNIPAARRALADGAKEQDLALLVRAVAYETVFDMLYYLDDDSLDAAGLPDWALMELDETGTPTGRLVEGLYESLLTLDPSGRDGQDLWI